MCRDRSINSIRAYRSRPPESAVETEADFEADRRTAGRGKPSTTGAEAPESDARSAAGDRAYCDRLLVFYPNPTENALSAVTRMTKPMIVRERHLYPGGTAGPTDASTAEITR
ncbi:MAG: hypothetical protein JXA30_03425 [Deltaproteobacteria bacterium]|nr:hypothetical protein [Deltaproteobacteria bacterium]